ncbi:MAG: DNA endonuclease SmrA [marine bacterium B5-7]|nr:MAG: DNA endonuclease SmrA [marine bacterium B5-7]
MSADDENTPSLSDLLSDVKPLKQDTITPVPPRRRKGVSSSVTGSFIRADNMDRPDSFHRSGLRPATLKKLRRGELRPQRTLDLHGYSRDRAQRMLESFLCHCVSNGHRQVLIIHGKGRRSEQQISVLKQMTRAILTTTDTVLAFAPAQPGDGGDGAVYVYLKSHH